MIKLIKPLFSFIVIFCINTINSQNQFRINYDIGNFDIPGGITEATSGNYVFAGFNSSALSFHSNVVELDVAGNVVWANKYESGFAFNISDIKTLSSSNYIVAGADNSDAILMNLDVSGNLSWGKSYSFLNATGSYCNRVKATSDGGYVIAGGVTGFDSDGAGPQPKRDSSNVFIFKTNSAGTLLWKKVIYVNIDDDHTVNDVAEVVDGYIFVGYVSEIGNPDIGDAIILKTDFLGNLQWFNKFGGAGNHQEFTSAETLTTGEVLIGGVNDGDNMWLIKINSSGSITWGYEYDPGGGWLGPDVAISFDAFETADNKYASLGMYVEFNLPPTIGSYLTKIEPSNGNIIFEKFYSSGMATIIPEGIQTTDQGYLMSMMAQQATGFNFHVLKTDLNGDTPASCAPGTISFSKTAYMPSPTSVSYTEFSDLGDNNFSPLVSAVTPNEVVDCITCSLTDPTPTATPDTICLGALTTIDATGSGTSVTYDVYAAATGGSSLGATPLILSPGTTTTYYVEASNGTCYSNRIAITVTVNPLPDAGTNGAITLCASDPSTDLFLQLAGSPDLGGTWSPIMASGTGIFDPALDAAGTYTYSVTNSCGTVTADVVVTITANPDPGTNGLLTLCTTDPATDLFLQLGGTPDPGGIWSPSINSGTGFFDPAVDASGTYTYTVTNVCGTTSADVVVNITSNPDPGTNGAITMCASDTSTDLFLQLGGNPVVGGTWTPFLASGTGIFDPALDASGTYTYSLSACGGGTLTADVIVNVDTLPLINAGLDLIVCDSFAITLSATGGQSYVWDNAVIDGVSFIQAIGTTTYNVIGTDINGCVNSDSVTITVNPQPSINMSSDTTICIGQSVDLFADTNGLLVEQFTMTFDNPFSYSTINTSLPGSYYVVVSGTFTTTGMPHRRDGAYNYGNNPATQNYEWKWNAQNPNTQSTWNNTYNTNHTYSFYFTGGTSQTFFFSEPINAPGYNPSWWNDNYGSLTFDIYYYGNILWSNGVTTSINNVSPSQTTNYTVSIDYGNGCATSGAVLVTTIANPDPGTNGAITYCTNSDSTDLFASLGGTPDSLGTWSPAMASGTGVFNPALDPSGTYTYSLPGCSGGFISSDVIVSVNSTSIVSSNISICQGDSILISGVYQNSAGVYTDTIINGNINGCDSISETTLSVLPIIDASIISDSIFCEEDPITILQAVNGGGVWSGSGITNSNTGAFNPSVATVGNHIITYKIPNSCGDSGTINILVNEIPNITKLTKDDSCLLSNGYIDLNIIGGTLPYSYYWNNGLTTEDLVDLTSGSYIIIVTDNEGCIKSDTIIIEDDLLLCGGSLWLPNIFSPNNDLLNDMLYVRGSETAQAFEFIIYNRWGQKVYYSTDPSAGWDGTFDGKILNDAVFAYLVTATFLDGTDAVLSGTITLVK